MSEILNFSCPFDNCGRKFDTKEKLDNHIKLRHPSMSKNINNNKINKPKPKTKNEIKKNKEVKTINNNQINKKTKINNNKKDGLEFESEKIKEEIKKMEEKENDDSKIQINNGKDKIKSTEEKKEKLQKEKNKIILDDLYSKINSLENYFENENLELQKQFEIAEIPNMDNILLENEIIENEENNNSNEINNIDTNITEENKKSNNELLENKQQLNINKEIKEDKKEDNKKKENEKEENEKTNKEEYDLNENQKNYDKDKVITITEELIMSNSDSKTDDFEEITSLNLSKKNIASFMNNRNVDFNEIPNLKKLNLSYNWMTYTYDLRLFSNIEELYLNDNKIDDISFVEFLPQLKILNCENNEITYITSLKKCSNLKILKLSQNKIQYLNSSLSVFKALNLLEELTIKDNPFLSEIFAYKQYFLCEFQNLLKFDNEEINDIDRDIAGRFVRKNNTMYKNTPLYNNINQNDEDLKNNDNLKDTFRVGNTIITKEMVVPYKEKGKYLNYKEKNALKEKDKAKNKEENDKNKELKDIIKSQKKDIEDLKLELENINQLNKDYEIIIEDCKNKLEQKKSKKNDINDIILKSNKEEEKVKLLKELEMWKKEYLDLFNKINQSSLFPSLLSNDKLKNPKSHFLKKETREEDENDINKINKDINIINKNKNKSKPNTENKKEIPRPQTAQVRSTNPENFEDLCKGLKIMYSKNQLLDVLEEDDSDDDDEEEEKEKKEINDNREEIDSEGNDIIPDDEIDELFRKSCADLQKMKDEIKFMNESLDKNGNNLLNNNNNININNKGGKMKLNPVIIKKENNPNFLGNRTIFGNLNQKKI